ncbi:MAG TPA: AMP-binding protein [Acidimicrobiales bacterium]|nr:AMP-binding protein [Acidimicrobiales bacterium]
MSPAAPRAISEVFAPVLADDPGRPALVTRSGRWTYAELDRLADRAAGALARLGVAPGDRVAAALPNEVDIVVAFHGAMRLGAVWVGVNRALAAPEKSFILSDSGASLLLCDQGTADQLASASAELPGLRRTVVVETADRTGDWPAALASVPDGERPSPVDPLAPAAIAYTSGTTGFPKGAVHSQHNLLLPGAALVASRRYGPSLRKGDCLPLTILNMLVLTTLLASQAGACSVIMDRIDAEGVAEWIDSEAVTTWNGPPALIHSLTNLASVRSEQLASLDEVWTGGADCPETMRQSFQAKFGQPVLATYGLTEAPTVVAIDGRDGSHRPGASGRPLPHLEVSIVGEDGERLERGQTGEICVGPKLDGPWAGAYRTVLGYWGRPDATEAVLRGGVLHTGDVGFLDEGGFLFVRDRKNQVIIRGGANVYPAEVERVIQAAPGVAACAVVGVPDERLGERVAAAVELMPEAQLSADDLTRHCLENLARYKTPERIVFVDGFDRNSMGKIDRRRLGSLFEADS